LHYCFFICGKSSATSLSLEDGDGRTLIAIAIFDFVIVVAKRQFDLVALVFDPVVLLRHYQRLASNFWKYSCGCLRGQFVLQS
jgi:hypothetical protein